MAMHASIAHMQTPAHPLPAFDEHGGNLGQAERRFPEAPRPWLDLSTGINSRSYPLPALSASAFARLPEAGDLARLTALAASVYGAPSPAHVACAPGTQVLLALLAGLVRPGRAGILSPTYAGHRRAALLAGHAVEEVVEPGRLGACDIAFLVNPNNPDGRLLPRAEVMRLGSIMAARGGLLVVDEAFMDVAPADASVAADVDAGATVVLRSFGKFFGLAGLRLGFAIAAPEPAERIRQLLGPWPVSGVSIEAATAALADTGWHEAARADLATRSARLDGLLAGAGIDVVGGTTLYRYARHRWAGLLAAELGRRGILVRSFGHDARALRFGIPGVEADFKRLAAALAQWRMQA